MEKLVTWFFLLFSVATLEVKAGGKGYESGSYVYNGEYKGVCDRDGFYFKDHSSLVLCSNSNAYVQPCAPGTRNSGVSRFEYGNSYHSIDFCDVNLVDYGYGAYRNYGNSYGNNNYGNNNYGDNEYEKPRSYGYDGGRRHGYGGYERRENYGYKQRDSYGNRGYENRGYGGYENDAYEKKNEYENRGYENRGYENRRYENRGYENRRAY